MNISFTIKEESKRMEEERFLALTPLERLMEFINSMSYFEQFPSKMWNIKQQLCYRFKLKTRPAS